MDPVGQSALAVVITLFAREAIPAVIKFMNTRHGHSREAAEDERKARKEEITEERKEAALQVRELKEVVELQRSDIKEFREEIHALRDSLHTTSMKVSACEAERAWLVGWIVANRSAFKSAGISYPDDMPEIPTPPKTGKMKIIPPVSPPPV